MGTATRGETCLRVRYRAMLVLSRKVGERIQVGDQITLTVVRISGGSVRLGIEAPKTMPIAREELQDSLQQEDADVPDQRPIGDEAF